LYLAYILSYGFIFYRSYVSALQNNIFCSMKHRIRIEKEQMISASKTDTTNPDDSSKVKKPRRKAVLEEKPISSSSFSSSTSSNSLPPSDDLIDQPMEVLVSTKGLVTKGEGARLVLGQRVAYPGDYVVHEQVSSNN